MFNTFCFGYKIGYKFIKSNRGVCNGNFLGIGADDCQTALVVEQSAPFGLLITNGEFVSFHGPDPTMVEVAQTNNGSVRFVNCAFWGPCNQIARIAGTGTVGFSDCNVDGRLITTLLPVKPLVNEVGIFSFSHAGIAITNVISQYGSGLEGIEYLVGYENPTVDCLSTLEAGYIDESGIAWENPFYQYPASFSQTEIHLIMVRPMGSGITG